MKMLFGPITPARLEELATAAHRLTRQHFGNAIKLYAPLYLSNECINDCTYCGFKRDNPIARITLNVGQVVREAEALVALGHRQLLLVSGEHPRAVSIDYLCGVVKALRPLVAELSIEVQPLDEASYRALIQAGVDGIVIYQETYDQQVYAAMHRSGPKKFFHKRLAAIDTAGRAGARSLSIGFLLGLAPWRDEAIELIAHARALMKRHWRSQLSVSFPRLTAAAPDFSVPHPVSDRDLAQLIIGTRIALPQADLVLSTREPAWLRDRLLPLGITRMSAGSRTDPGGYTSPGIAGEQFHLEDRRTPAEVAQAIADKGYLPIWKDAENLFR